jgi:hypothetical protein
LEGGLQIIPRIPLGCPDIFADISPERQYHIYNNRRPHCEKGGEDKKLADLAGGNAHPVANSCANSKGIPLNKTFEFVHDPKLKNLIHSDNNELFRQAIFVLLQLL